MCVRECGVLCLTLDGAETSVHFQVTLSHMHCVELHLNDCQYQFIWTGSSLC
jgi:hypothetical protein